MARNLDLTSLRSFVAIADAGGVTRASGFLNLTQSAVSMQIKRLEEALDLELLDRAGRGVSLTAAGEQMLGYARRMLSLNDEAIARLTHQAWEGEIVLGVPSDIVYPAIPKVLQQFARDYPRMRVTLVSSYTRRLKALFARGDADIVLTTEDSCGPEGETLSELPLVWIGAPGGSAWKARPLPLAFEHNCIFRVGVQQALDRAGIPWVMAVESDSTRTIEASVSADLAVHALVEGAMPRYLQEVQHGGALPDLARTRINLYVAEPSHGPAVEQMAEMIRDAIGGGQAAHRDHDLAGRGARAQKLQRFGGPVERQAVADMRMQAAFGMPAQQLGEALGQHLGPEAEVAAPVDADQAEVLDQQQVGGHLRHLAAGKADGEDAALGPGGAQRLQQAVAADRIIDHIGAAEAAHRLAQIFGVAVDQVVGAGGAGHGELFRPARAGDDSGAHQLADLDRGQPDPAGRAEHQKRLAGVQAGAVGKCDMAGRIGDLKGGGLGEGHRIGQGHAARGGKAAGLGQAALSGEDRDPGAGGGPGHAGAELGDGSGHLHPEGEGEGGAFLIAALQHQEVGEVQPAGGNRQPHLVRSGARIGHLSQGCGVSEAVDLIGAHAGSRSAGTGPAVVREC